MDLKTNSAEFNREIFSKRLKLLRELKGISQAQFANELGVTYSHHLRGGGFLVNTTTAASYPRLRGHVLPRLVMYLVLHS